MKDTKSCEREYDFALYLTGVTELTSEVEDALFEAGCDDATLGIQYGGALLTFSRTAPSLKDAILSAIGDVRKAKFDVHGVDICDLVTQADIARRINRTRQNVHQFITGVRGPGGFPPPSCHISESSPLWQWCEVAHWLRQNDMIKEYVLSEAWEVAVINSVLVLQRQRQLQPDLTKEVVQFIIDNEAGIGVDRDTRTATTRGG